MLSRRVLSTKQCFICQKEFSFGEIILRDFNNKEFSYYHITCLQGDNNSIYYCGIIRNDQFKNSFVGLDEEKKCQFVTSKTDFDERKLFKEYVYQRFDKSNIHDYGQLLFERFKRRYKFEDLPDERYQDIIDPMKRNSRESNDNVCINKDWDLIHTINDKQCAHCHTCWLYQKQYDKQSSFIRCNLCGKHLTDKLTEDIIAMNFVHPNCFEKYINEL